VDCIGLAKRVAIIQGHPDPVANHLLHAMADAYADCSRSRTRGPTRRGGETGVSIVAHNRQISRGTLPLALVQARDDMRWAKHWVFLFPLWHGTMRALFKGFLEHIFRRGFAMEYDEKGFPKRLLAGRSARIVVTMGMPVILYRCT
jgi:putative NADPH-quinone reductase